MADPMEVGRGPRKLVMDPTDPVSLARCLRLAVVQMQYDVGNITEEQAKEVLSGFLDGPEGEIIMDDSDCLEVKDG